MDPNRQAESICYCSRPKRSKQLQQRTRPACSLVKSRMHEKHGSENNSPHSFSAANSLSSERPTELLSAHSARRSDPPPPLMSRRRRNNSTSSKTTKQLPSGPTDCCTEKVKERLYHALCDQYNVEGTRTGALLYTACAHSYSAALRRAARYASQARHARNVCAIHNHSLARRKTRCITTTHNTHRQESSALVSAPSDGRARSVSVCVFASLSQLRSRKPRELCDVRKRCDMC